jgi:hypothetical protein
MIYPSGLRDEDLFSPSASLRPPRRKIAAYAAAAAVVSGAVIAIVALSSGSKPAPQDLNGNVQVHYTNSDATDTCGDGTRTVRGIKEGSLVTIKDGNGKTIATTTLDSGMRGLDGAWCDYTFLVTVPQVSSYNISIGNPAATDNWPLSQLKSTDWTITAPIGAGSNPYQ